MGMTKKIVWGMGVWFLIATHMAMAGQAVKPGPTVQSDHSYTIGHGDVLRIFTWKEPELSVEAATVRLDGKITFPLVNDVQAAGLSPMQLKKILEDRLAGYVESPIVTVMLINPVSQRYYVLGEVQRIGEYPIEKNMTIMQAFAVAGGFTQWAAKDEILLIRRVQGNEQVFRINYKGFLKGRDLDNNIRIKADDTIIVP
ncbi:polysaccharide biosynthesis/export family protein [Desulfocicer niacini]